MGLFSDDNSGGIFSGSSNHTCPATSLDEDSTVLVVGNFTFYEINRIVSGAFTAATCVTIFTLMAMHSINMTKSNEQVKIMKICLMIPLYSLISFLSVYFPKAAVYLGPWQDFYESLAMGYFFLLLGVFISPSDQQRDLFFAAFRVPQKKNEDSPINGIEWYRKRWIAIFQYPIVALGVAVATAITQAVGIYCEESNKPYFAHLWIEIISNVSLGLCLTSILAFYTALKKNLVGHHPLTKLLAFKLLIGLSFLESIIFLILTSTNALHATATMTYADVKVGIPNLLICVQTLLFSLFFHYAYKVSPYRTQSKEAILIPSHEGQYGPGDNYNQLPPSYNQSRMSAGRAWLAMLDPREILSAIKFMFTMRSEAEMGTSYDGGYGGNTGLEPLRRNRYSY
ncbi:organic solute transporter Ostalpha-domain-containing protein [Talaromyces proteolyticus]|uniref:Organic solute transporter Ostalpha-domain-containing protein n=1 Tax=Talaromyces proteolyticus TaxID=1131652 RepID=A0AAD4Q023_9EURO|nr:organic solute transporter Ostalpha-domain-containing protein [Talaromyces proteolyticus]KAH8696576.1 organic solute transporter Ostalpha-domain-containing protein [Talaromyces proteolyticus]